MTTTIVDGCPLSFFPALGFTSSENLEAGIRFAMGRWQGDEGLAEDGETKKKRVWILPSVSGIHTFSPFHDSMKQLSAQTLLLQLASQPPNTILLYT